MVIPTGTIKAAIALYDGVTSPLRSMHKAMGVVLNTFESMQQASGRAVDTAAIREAREEWARAGTAFDAIEENIKRANDEQNKFNNSIRNGNTNANGLLSTVKKLAVAVGGVTGITKALSLSDDLSSTKARLNLIVDDGGSVGDLEKKIMASAQRSRAAYFDTANAIASMGANAKSAFSGNDELVAFVEQINKQFAIGGASAQGQSAAMLQLTQAMGAGALRGEELNSILENAPGIARAIEQYMGVAEGSIKQYAEQGMITAEVVKNALLSAAKDSYDEFGNLIEGTNSKFESMPMTWGQIWTSMKNQALSVFSPILTKINEIGNSSRFQQVTTGLINGLAAVANVASYLLDILISVASVFVDNWGIIQPLVLGIAAAMLLYNGYLIANNAITAISNAQKGIAAVKAYAAAAATTTLTASEKAEAMAKASATAAQYGFNAALLACPITWILLIIIAVIAAIYGIVAAINKLTGSTISATGIIGGAFAVAGAFIINTFIVPLQNRFATFVNFLGNVFNDPIAAIKVAFYDMVLTVIGYISKLAHAIETVLNKIPGVTVDITSGLDNFYSGIEEAQKEIKDEAGWVEYVQKMDYIDYSDAASAGYKFGEGIADKVSGMFDASGMDAMGAFDLGNTLDGIYDNTGDTVANTAASADKLDIAEEDLKYMKDIAEREAINRFTTAEIHVEQHNENHISKDTDVDGIMDIWANDFAEKLEISEEGVHE